MRWQFAVLTTLLAAALVGRCSTAGDPWLLPCSTPDVPCNISSSFCDFNYTCRPNTCINHFKYDCFNDTSVYTARNCSSPFYTDCATAASGFLCNIGPTAAEISCNVSKPRVDGTLTVSAASTVAFANGPVAAVSSADASVGPDPTRLPAASDLKDEIQAVANQTTPKPLPFISKGTLAGALQQVAGAITQPRSPPPPSPSPSATVGAAAAPAPAAPTPGLLLSALRGAQALAGSPQTTGAGLGAPFNWTALFNARPAGLKSATLPQLQALLQALQTLAQNQQATVALQQFLASAPAQQLLVALVQLAVQDPAGLNALLALLQDPAIFQAAVDAKVLALQPLLDMINAANPTDLTISLVQAMNVNLAAIPGLASTLVQLGVAAEMTGNATALSAAIVSLAAQGAVLTATLLPLAVTAASSLAASLLGIAAGIIGNNANLITPVTALLRFAQQSNVLPPLVQLGSNATVASAIVGLAGQPAALVQVVNAARGQLAAGAPGGLLALLLQAMQAAGAR